MMNTSSTHTNAITPPVSSDHSQLFVLILPTAMNAIIGALISDCIPKEKNICNCEMSLVVRVIRLAVEKRLISSFEKPTTLRYISPRSRAEKRDAICAVKNVVQTVSSIDPSAHSSILPPASRISLIWLPSVCTRRVISDI